MLLLGCWKNFSIDTYPFLPASETSSVFMSWSNPCSGSQCLGVFLVLFCTVSVCLGKSPRSLYDWSLGLFFCFAFFILSLNSLGVLASFWFLLSPLCIGASYAPPFFFLFLKLDYEGWTVFFRDLGFFIVRDIFLNVV